MSRGATISVIGLYNSDPGLFSEMVYPSGFSDEDKQTTVDNILTECAELECLFADAGAMKAIIGFWSKMNIFTWNRIFSAAQEEYNPIENYNRTELETIADDHTDTHSGNDVNRTTGTDSHQISEGGTTTNSGTDTRTLSSSGTTTNSGTDTQTNKINSYDSGTLLDHDQNLLQHGHSVTDSNSGSDALAHGHMITDSKTGTDAVTYGKTDTMTHGEIITHDGDVTRNLHVSGNIGTMTSQQMLLQEIEVAAKMNVIKMIVEAFKERFCLLVY